MKTETVGTAKQGNDSTVFKGNEKARDIRSQNIVAARAVADVVRTSLGPKGMDKMIQDSKGGVIITNDGATILNQMAVVHPTARMLVDLSVAQDVEAGDGTTTVVIMAGALLGACQQLLERGIHPQTIARAFAKAAAEGQRILEKMALPVALCDRAQLVLNASTALNSKVVSQSAGLLAPLAVDAVIGVTDIQNDSSVDLRKIRVVKKLGGTVDDCELINGVVFTQQKVARRAGGPTHIEGAKIGLIQFCLSAPKTDMENSITVKDYQAMDRLLREERLILAKMVKQIAATGCNVLLIQKSILRDATNDLSLDYLAKSKILVIKDIERDDVEFIANTCGCDPVASLDEFTSAKLGQALSVSDVDLGGDSHVVKILVDPKTAKQHKTVTILLRASNQLMLDEAERSLHDALCVVRCLVKNKAVLPGGGAPEIEVSMKLAQWSLTLTGKEQECVRAYAESMELLPFTLAENAGLDPLLIVTQLKKMHSASGSTMGINIRKALISNMVEEKVVQPLFVTLSALKLATETVMMIMKIDDIVLSK